MFFGTHRSTGVSLPVRPLPILSTSNFYASKASELALPKTAAGHVSTRTFSTH